MADMNDTANGLVRRAEAVLRANGPLWELMREASAGTAVTGASYSYYLTLYEQVRAIRPREILECGAGISTGVLAYALMENAREDGGAPGRVTSMEDDRDWFKTAQVRLPEARFESAGQRLIGQKSVEIHRRLRDADTMTLRRDGRM